MSRPKNQSGFTIVELIVAIVVGGIMFTSLHSMYTSQTYLSQRGRDLVLANAYVEGKVEALRSAGYLSLTNGTFTITSELPAELNSPRTGTLVVSSFSTSIKQLDISLTYNEQGTSRTYSYRTFIGELGVGQY